MEFKGLIDVNVANQQFDEFDVLVVEERNFDEFLEDHTRKFLPEWLLATLFTQFYLLAKVTLYASKRKTLDLEKFVDIDQLYEAVFEEEVEQLRLDKSEQFLS